MSLLVNFSIPSNETSLTFGLRLYGGAMAHFPWDLERARPLITVLLATFTTAEPIGGTVLPCVSNQPTFTSFGGQSSQISREII